VTDGKLFQFRLTNVLPHDDPTEPGSHRSCVSTSLTSFPHAASDYVIDFYSQACKVSGSQKT